MKKVRVVELGVAIVAVLIMGLVSLSFAELDDPSGLGSGVDYSYEATSSPSIPDITANVGPVDLGMSPIDVAGPNQFSPVDNFATPFGGLTSLEGPMCTTAGLEITPSMINNPMMSSPMSESPLMTPSAGIPVDYSAQMITQPGQILNERNLELMDNMTFNINDPASGTMNPKEIKTVYDSAVKETEGLQWLKGIEQVARQTDDDKLLKYSTDHRQEYEANVKAARDRYAQIGGNLIQLDQTVADNYEKAGRLIGYTAREGLAPDLKEQWTAGANQLYQNTAMQVAQTAYGARAITTQQMAAPRSMSVPQANLVVSSSAQSERPTTAASRSLESAPKGTTTMMTEVRQDADGVIGEILSPYRNGGEGIMNPEWGNAQKPQTASKPQSSVPQAQGPAALAPAPSNQANEISNKAWQADYYIGLAAKGVTTDNKPASSEQIQWFVENARQLYNEVDKTRDWANSNVQPTVGASSGAVAASSTGLSKSDLKHLAASDYEYAEKLSNSLNITDKAYYDANPKEKAALQDRINNEYKKSIALNNEAEKSAKAQQPGVVTAKPTEADVSGAGRVTTSLNTPKVVDSPNDTGSSLILDNFAYTQKIQNLYDNAVSNSQHKEASYYAQEMVGLTQEPERTPVGNNNDGWRQKANYHASMVEKVEIPYPNAGGYQQNVDNPAPGSDVKMGNAILDKKQAETMARTFKDAIDNNKPLPGMTLEEMKRRANWYITYAEKDAFYPGAGGYDVSSTTGKPSDSAKNQNGIPFWYVQGNGEWEKAKNMEQFLKDHPENIDAVSAKTLTNLYNTLANSGTKAEGKDSSYFRQKASEWAARIR